MGSRTDGAARKEGAEGGVLQALLGSAGIPTPRTRTEPEPQATSTWPDQQSPTQLPTLEISQSSRTPPSPSHKHLDKTAALPPSPVTSSCLTRPCPSHLGIPRPRTFQMETLGLCQILGKTESILPNTSSFAKKESGRKLSSATIIFPKKEHFNIPKTLKGCYPPKRKVLPQNRSLSSLKEHTCSCHTHTLQCLYFLLSS